MFRKIYSLILYHLIVRHKIKRVVTEYIGKFRFKIYPSVFNPRDFLSSEIFAKFISSLDLKGKKILDMGSGSGIVSIFAASIGAECKAVDINPMAVRSIKENAELNGFGEKIIAIESDLYSTLQIPSPPSGRRVKEGFNIIFFNPPYYKGEPKNNFERAFKGGKSLDVVKRFAEQTPDHLNPEGIVYLILSSDIDIEEFKKIFSAYRFDIVTKYNKFFETFYICKLVVI